MEECEKVLNRFCLLVVVLHFFSDSCLKKNLAHQNRTIAIASDVRVDGAKSPEILQKEEVSGSEIATRNRKSLATFHRTLESQLCNAIAIQVSEVASDFWGPRWASQS